MGKWLVIFVFSCLAVGAIAFLIESSSIYDIHGFNFSDVKSITIYNRGLNGNDIIEIKDKQKIQQIGRFINSSVNIKQFDYNPRATSGLCELHILSKENKNTTITLDRNDDVGGIITSGQWHYKSDSLLLFVLKELSK